jgi:hypothetical protein
MFELKFEIEFKVAFDSGLELVGINNNSRVSKRLHISRIATERKESFRGPVKYGWDNTLDGERSFLLVQDKDGDKDG